MSFSTWLGVPDPLVVRVWQQSHQASIDNLDIRDTPKRKLSLLDVCLRMVHKQQSAVHVQRSVLMAKA